MAYLVERYGAANILGRPLSYNEVVRMEKQSRLINIGRAMGDSKNWAEFAKANPNAVKEYQEALRQWQESK